jgi:hypothetical protein
MKMIFLFIALSMLFSCDQKPQSNEVKGQEEEKAALNYLFQLVETNQVEKALALLNEIIDPSEIPDVNREYVEQFKTSGVSESFLRSEKFTKFDFFYLKQVLLFSNLTRSAKAANKSKSDLIEELYHLVRKKINGDVEKDNSAFPMQIWQREYGVCDRQSWVLCELAYQAGADVYVVYLRDPITSVSHHTICEVVYDGNSYIVDPLYGKFLKNKSLNTISNSEVKEIWKDYPILHNEFSKSTVWVPSMPNDYAPRMQSLGILSREILKENSPRFGEDPLARLIKKSFKKDLKLWNYPLRILAYFDEYKAKEK